MRPRINMKSLFPDMEFTCERWSHDRLIFNMGIPILIRRHRYSATPPFCHQHFHFDLKISETFPVCMMPLDAMIWKFHSVRSRKNFCNDTMMNLPTQWQRDIKAVASNPPSRLQWPIVFICCKYFGTMYHIVNEKRDPWYLKAYAVFVAKAAIVLCWRNLLRYDKIQSKIATMILFETGQTTLVFSRGLIALLHNLFISR